MMYYYLIANHTLAKTIKCLNTFNGNMVNILLPLYSLEFTLNALYVSGSNTKFVVMMNFNV